MTSRIASWGRRKQMAEEAKKAAAAHAAGEGKAMPPVAPADPRVKWAPPAPVEPRESKRHEERVAKAQAERLGREGGKQDPPKPRQEGKLHRHRFSRRLLQLARRRERSFPNQPEEHGMDRRGRKLSRVTAGTRWRDRRRQPRKTDPGAAGGQALTTR